MSNILQIIQTRLKKDNTLLAIIIGLVLMVFTVFIPVKIIGFVSAVLLFSAFDVEGFTSLRQDSEALINYRIIQLTFQFLLYGFLYSTCGIFSVLAFIVAHWFTTCDKLFYTLSKTPDFSFEYTWLNSWSIFLILNKIGVKAFTKSFNTVALIGFILGCLICIL